jgi:hypothetical protein
LLVRGDRETIKFPLDLKQRAFMSTFPNTSYERVVQRWRDLADRRRAHYVELYHSGRWRHYYTEEQFLKQMREAIEAFDVWARIAPRSNDLPDGAEASPFRLPLPISI